ncbi:MAG: vacuolar family H+-ATPase subunit H [Lachnospiraceae bacterium]|nr:vacuolar family H+-ATPase subunit H [Lachnospiraceae bacterium]
MASENPSTSAIEEVINEIEVYIDNCKYQPLSNTKIIVNKEEIDELIRELRMKIPEEVRRYQKIITNKEAILNDARTKARSLLDETAEQSHELLSDHEITKLANEQAQKMIDEAALKARGIIDEATRQANAMKASAVQYTDRLLKEFEQVLSRTISTTQRSYESFTGQLARYQETVHSNREELKPALSNAPAYETAEAASYDAEQEGYAETADGIQEAEE